MSTGKATPVIELLRVSTQEQDADDRAGMSRQKEATRRAVESNGLRVVRTVELVDVSGASVMRTPEVAEMIEQLRRGEAEGIVAADFDRILRPDDFRGMSILQDIKEAGALIYLPDQVVDLNTQSGYLMSGLQSIIAGNELQQIKKRMLGAKEQRRRQGKCPGGDVTLPLGVGYDRTSELYYYNGESHRVRELFDLFHRGEHNYRELEKRTGIHHRNIPNLLRNEIYIGYRSYRQKRAPKPRYDPNGKRLDKPKVPRREDEVIRVRVIGEPLISEQVFWSVQEALQNRRSEYTSRRIQVREAFLFRGHLKCGVCGSPVYAVSGGKNAPRKDYYTCRDKKAKPRSEGEKCPSCYLRRDLVDERVLDFISEQLSDPELILSEIRSICESERSRESEKRREEMEARIDSLKRKREKLLDLYLKGVYSEEEVTGKANEILEEKQRLERQLEGLGQREVFNAEDYRQAAEDLAFAFSEFKFWDRQRQREFLGLSGAVFYVDPEGINGFRLRLGDSGAVDKKGSRTPADIDSTKHTPAPAPPSRSSAITPVFPGRSWTESTSRWKCRLSSTRTSGRTSGLWTRRPCANASRRRGDCRAAATRGCPAGRTASYPAGGCSGSAPCPRRSTTSWSRR